MTNSRAQRRRSVPPRRTAHLAGDELATPGRLIHLFRDSYAGAQGRQWLQPHVLWWILVFLRSNGIRVDWSTLTSPALAQTVTTLALPPRHTEVQPTDQKSMNFGLWWPILTELARIVYRPWWLRLLPLTSGRLPSARQVEVRAERLGLRPWMSSSTFEEMSGIGRSLSFLREHDRLGVVDGDEFMMRVLLPELLIVELQWIHAPGGRPRTTDCTVEVVLLERYDRAKAKWTKGDYLTPLEHMYLRAGDILHHLAALPKKSTDPLARRIMGLYDELRSTTARL